tara:strand:+ start:277 stop:549 length:273 start_codon:yes stop_codon:yes gene_type:complete
MLRTDASSATVPWSETRSSFILVANSVCLVGTIGNHARFTIRFIHFVLLIETTHDVVFLGVFLNEFYLLVVNVLRWWNPSFTSVKELILL